MRSPIRILHLEDNREDMLLVKSVLESEGLDCEILNVSNREDFVAALAEGTFDLILSDYALPSFDGITALDMVRGRNPDVPFIFVSGTMGEELAIESLKAGATDYVLKDRLSRLVPSVRRALAEAREREERRRDTARMAMRFAVTNALAQSATLEEAAPKLLQAMGEGAAWDAGAVWLADPTGTALSCIAFWRRPSREVVEFENVTRAISFEKGVGLPGRVWASGEPAWIPDLSADTNFPRAVAARAVGLRTGCGFPIRSGTRVIGVIDFFSHESRTPDEALSRILGDVGIQIGQFLERREAEESLRRSEKRLAEAQRVAHVGSWEFELRSGRAFWSEESYRILGEQSDAEMSFERFLSFVHPDDRDLIGKTVAKALEDRQPFQIDYRIVRPDAAVRSVQARGELVSGADGTPKRMVGTVQDITERVSLEAQLLQSQKIEAIGTLAGGIAHDFNNLLTSILGYSDLALSRVAPGNGLQEDLEEIRKAGERAAALTRQLLAFSRKQVLTPVVLDLNAVVADLERMLRRLIGEDVDLVSRLDPASGRVKADPGQIEQVIVNLVVNSRDAMPRGGKVTIETRNVDLGDAYTRGHAYVPPGRYVLLAVSDTGAGMDAETRSRIFEPFFTTKGAGKGTGLGLSTVYGIVKQSGGHIQVYSEPGRGTTFKIYLPRTEEGAPRSTPPPVTRPGRGCETILLVEDEEALRALARRILEAQGYTVLEAASAEDALEIAESHSGTIHLMLTDAVMPGQSGPELARRLGPARPGMKVLFMSGYTDDAIVRHGLLSSSQAFLQKPFSPDALTGKVREVLDSARG